jgi:hypothetical protein
VYEAAGALERLGRLGQERPEDLEDMRGHRVELEPGAAWVLSQDADLHLRGGVRARVTWPPDTPVERPPLLVFVPPRGVPADALLCHELAVHIPAVVLAADSGSFHAAREALEWGADHAAELGADPRRLVLVGEHRGATVVAALARHARDRGWPQIAHAVLIDPASASNTVDALARMFRVAVAAEGDAGPDQSRRIHSGGNTGGIRPG